MVLSKLATRQFDPLVPFLVGPVRKEWCQERPFLVPDREEAMGRAFG